MGLKKNKTANGEGSHAKNKNFKKKREEIDTTVDPKQLDASVASHLISGGLLTINTSPDIPASEKLLTYIVDAEDKGIILGQALRFDGHRCIVSASTDGFKTSQMYSCDVDSMKSKQIRNLLKNGTVIVCFATNGVSRSGGLLGKICSVLSQKETEHLLMRGLMKLSVTKQIISKDDDVDDATTDMGDVFDFDTV